MKQKVFKFAKWAGGLACVILGLAIGGFGVAQFIPQKKYAGGDISIKPLPEKEEEEAK